MHHAEFQNIRSVQESKEIAKSIYLATENFPENEKFGIISQLRRAGASIGANIAEGCGRHTSKDFLKFLYIALGSINECAHFLVLSNELKYIDNSKFTEITGKLDTTARKLNSFIQAVKYGMCKQTAKPTTKN